MLSEAQTHELITVYAAAAAPLIVVLAVRRAPWRTFLTAPIIAVITAAAGVLLWSTLRSTLMQRPGIHPHPMFMEVAGVLFIATLAVGVGIFLTRRPVREAVKRGTVIEEGPASRSKPRRDATTLAGVAIPALDETKHFKLIGTTGSGKSTAIRELLTGALNRGDRAIIADPDGGYLKTFYRPQRGDVILNPFDDRSATWDLFAEIEQPYDVEQLARSLIPEGPDVSGQEWRNFGRILLAAVMEYCKLEGPAEIQELWRLMAVADQSELLDKLAGSAAQPYLAEGAQKMLQSIRGTTTPMLNTLKYARAGRAPAVSVREWVQSGKGVLFMPYQAGQIAALRGLVATWLRIAIFETMSRPEGDQRLWFVIDELDALGQIDGLKDALARLRKFGGRCVIGFQSIAQVRGTYGDPEAQTIVENCGNTLILRCSQSERGGTAEFASRLIGKREVLRPHITETAPRGFLVAGHRTQSSSIQHTVEDAVMASEIEKLPDLGGYLKLASGDVWRKVELAAPR